MRYHDVPASVAVAGHPLAATLAGFPTACFVLTLAMDIAYWRTGILQWQDFAEWLLFAGTLVAGIVLAMEFLGLLFSRPRREFGPGWLHVLGTAVVLVLAFINNLVHARDGWTAVVPMGLTLSALTVLAIIATAFVGRATVRRRVLDGGRL